MDTSKQRGNMNYDIKQYKIGYTGNKQEMYTVQKCLGDPDSRVQLVHVNGTMGIGKTRFAHQVGYFFCARYYF